MPWFDVFWTDSRVRKLSEHGITQDDFERIVMRFRNPTRSRSRRDRQAAFGHTADGRYVICVYELLDDGITIIPVTAYEVPRAERAKTMKREIRRHDVTMTELEKRRWEQAVRETEEELPELMERGRRLLAAAEEPTVSGSLRRAAQASELSFDEVVERLGVPEEDYSDFQAGVRPLPSDVIDRLARILGCELVATTGAAPDERASSRDAGSIEPATPEVTARSPA